jgi:hypothetical protein
MKQMHSSSSVSKVRSATKKKKELRVIIVVFEPLDVQLVEVCCLSGIGRKWSRNCITTISKEMIIEFRKSGALFYDRLNKRKC